MPLGKLSQSGPQYCVVSLELIMPVMRVGRTSRAFSLTYLAVCTRVPV